MIESDRHVGHLANDDLSVAYDGSVFDLVDPKNPQLGVIDDGRSKKTADGSSTGDRNGRTREAFSRNAAIATGFGKALQVSRKFEDVLLVRIEDHRYQETGIAVEGKATMNIAIVDDLAGLLVELCR